jgi:ankyrin repeat protein
MRRYVTGSSWPFGLLLGLVASGALLSGADGTPPIVAAAKSRDARQVQALLAQRADVNARAGDGSTALLWAAHWGDAALADRLLGAGADPNLANDFRMTALALACTNADARLIARLLAAGANPNIPVGTGETPLMTCASTGSVDAVRVLLTRGANANAAEPTERQTALMWAASEKHPAVVRLLVEAGADVRAHSKKGFTALHFAAREGDLESVRALLAAGVDIDIRSTPDPPPERPAVGGPRGQAYQATLSAGATPLLVATVRNQVPLALALLETGANPNVIDAGFAPLHWAVGLWEGGVSNPTYGFSDAMSGIPDRQAKLRLVRALLAHGANPNLRMTKRPPTFVGGYEDAPGATPFIIASAAADVEIMKLLQAAGANPALLTDSNTTAVMAASGLHRLIGESATTEREALDTVRYLISLGGDGMGATTFGENALFGAAYRGWNTLLALLIDKGADVNAVSKAGVTPWLAASGYGDRLGGVLYNTEGADLLKQHGADPTLGRPCQAQNKCR